MGSMFVQSQEVHWYVHEEGLAYITLWSVQSYRNVQRSSRYIQRSVQRSRYIQRSVQISLNVVRAWYVS